MRSRIWILLLFGILVSCSFFKKTDDRDAIARVNDSYLYAEDLKGLISSEISKEDSTLLVQNYITSWATQQLLFDGAKLNLSESKQESFNRLVDQYKNDLYAKAYLEGLVSRNVDTVVTFEEAEVYYNENKTIFKLNEELIKFRYIQVEEQINNFSSIEKRFKRFNNEDKKELDSISIQFKSYSLNDSIWVKVSQVIDKISVLNSGNKSELYTTQRFIRSIFDEN